MMTHLWKVRSLQGQCFQSLDEGYASGVAGGVTL